MKGRAVVEPGEGARAAERAEKADAADRGEGDGATAAADPRKSVTVPVAAAEAFRIYTEYPAEWLPAEHTFIPNPRSIAMEPRTGGRFYERGDDGAEITRGTIVEWAPPHRLAVTWRIGPGWRPVFDDEHASVIVVEFTPAGPDATEVTATYTHLDRHGNLAGMLRAAIETGDTLDRYADVAARHATTA
jgi:uncharacterized protein YndB with AHSA1/START domain